MLRRSLTRLLISLIERSETRRSHRPVSRKNRRRTEAGHPRPAGAMESLEQRVVPTVTGGELLAPFVDPGFYPGAGVAAFQSDSILIQLHAGTEIESVTSAIEAAEVRSLNMPGQDWFEIVLASGSSLTEVVDQLAVRDDVALIMPNYELSLTSLESGLSAPLPNDTRFDELYGLHNTGQRTGWLNDADIDAPEAWEYTTGSSQIIVAVIDTGVDYTHPDLVENIWVNTGEVPGNGLDDDANGYVDDVHGYDFVNNDGDPFDDHHHGTHVAGTIAARSGNGIGVAGVAPNVTIMPLKFLGANGSGNTADAVRALNYAVAQGAAISNNSWGGGGFNAAMLAALHAARDAGHIFVAAAGNAALNNDQSAVFPANYNIDNVVSVAASNSQDQLASFSNYGAASVELAAPGVSILSTYPNNQYASLSGTSMAAPHVSGVMALVRSLRPEWTFRQVIDQVLNTVDSIGALQGKTITGGRLNAHAAVAGAASESGLFVTDESVREGEEVRFTVSLDSAASHPVSVNYATTALTAQAGSDYAEASGTITFAPGETSKTIVVATLDDDAAESADETFELNLSSASGGVIRRATGLATIRDTDPLLRIHAEVKDENGFALTTIAQGQTFRIDVFAQDRRVDGDQAGVLSAFASLRYDTALVDVVEIVTGLDDFHTGAIHESDGLVENAGGLTMTAPGSRNPQRLFSLIAIARETGSLTFDLSAATGPLAQNQLFGFDGDVGERIEFVDASIDIAKMMSLSLETSQVMENAGSFTARISRGSFDTTEPLEVRLSLSDSARLRVPDAVTIPAGEVSVEFTVEVLDDHVLNETTTVTLTATADGVLDAVREIQVRDHETLTVALSTSEIREDAGPAAVTGTVTRSDLDDLSQALEVTLISSDPSEATVPATVVIPAGTASVTFPISIVDDAEVDGTQSVRITASASGFEDGSETLNVTDLELADLVVTSFALPDDVAYGTFESLAYSFTVENRGTVKAEPFRISMLQSDDALFGNDDDQWRAGWYFPNGLAAGGKVTLNYSLTLNLIQLLKNAQREDAPGQGIGHVSTHVDYLGVIVDPENAVPESNEDNNLNQGQGLDSDDFTYFPWDTDRDGLVEPTDAGYVINRVGQTVTYEDRFADQDGNGLIAPTEAAAAVNRIGYTINRSVFETADDAGFSSSNDWTSDSLDDLANRGIELERLLSPVNTPDDSGSSEEGDPDAAARLFVAFADAEGRAVTQIRQGETFQIHVSAQDLSSSGSGLWSLFTDAVFDPQLIEVLELTPASGRYRSGAVDQQSGAIQNSGWFDPPSADTGNLPVFTVTARARNVGHLTFTTTDASGVASETVRRGGESDLRSLIEHGSGQLRILSALPVSATFESQTGQLTLTLDQSATIVLADDNGLLAISVNGESLTLDSSISSSALRQLTIQGSGGADVIDLRSVTRQRFTGLQKAIINGGAGADTIYGSDVRDVIDGGAGHDWISGRKGHDAIRGGAGNDTLYGDIGNDRLLGENGNDSLLGGAGHDTLLGGAGDDELKGNEGRDVLSGEDGHDRLYGQAGNDQLNGGAGDDLLSGGEGRDHFEDSTGINRLVDPNRDHLRFSSSTAPGTAALQSHTVSAGSTLSDSLDSIWTDAGQELADALLTLA